jgi:mannosyl-3-phosphoglycerate phosphatase
LIVVHEPSNRIAEEKDHRLVVFSDLDGTLLDHDTYEWQIAAPAIDELKRRGYPIVLVSSKTLAEIEGYRDAMRLAGPVVAENGAVISVPGGYFRDAPIPGTPAPDREELQKIFEEIRAGAGYDCQGFYELGAAGIAAATGLSRPEAARANERVASEPILWRDSPDRIAGFASAAERRGLRCIQGGRFLHLMGQTDKADAVGLLLDAYHRKWPQAELTSVALGDGPNDLDMLRAADVAVVIRGKHSHAMPLDGHARVVSPDHRGPAGWLSAIEDMLAEIDRGRRPVNAPQRPTEV